MTTITDMSDVLGLAALDVDLDPVPTVGVPEPQGDVTLIPWGEAVSAERRARDSAAATIVASPVTVARGNGGNVHLLVDPDGCGVRWHPYPGAEPQTVGVIVVPEGGRACLDHAEHGRSAIGAGVWIARRQREQADAVRLVAD